MLHMRNRYPSENIVAILLLLASHRHMATNQICLQHKEAQFKMQEGAPHSLEKETSNSLIFKCWPPLTTCQPGIAWKPPASTLAHRLAVIHPDIRMRWPEGLGAKPVPSTADVRTAPQHAPHTRPTVCEKTSNTGYRKQANRHRLWIYSWVGQRCLAEPAQDVADHNQIESLSLNC